LSYTWGQPEPKFSVLLNGVDFGVRENLYLALLRLRLPNKPFRIWIDAVCINQDGVEEREFQVSIMRHVYYLATYVIAWVGEESVTSDMVAWIKSITAHGIVNSRWLGLLDLISRPWFSRVWI
ncbi:heterokaryon incompatibility, partial [Apiosordaria backusii]